MDSKRVSYTLPFRGFDIYNMTSYVQEHTLINRGITTLGGSTIPQCIMSNNKNEAQERAIMGGIYFIASYLTPILLIPVYNRHFLKNKGITKELKSAGEKIIEVSKKYLTPDGNLKEGLKITAERLDKKSGGNTYQKAFSEIYDRYNNDGKLKKDLLSVHEKIMMTDFITTATMWSAIPWIATEFTEHRTKRSDFSAGFELKKEKPQQKTDLKKSKEKKLFWNALFVTIPGIIFSKTVTKGIAFDKALSASSKSIKNKVLENIASKPEKFDYASGTNMSKAIYAAIWVLSSFPAKIISSRDANERRDRALRDIGLFTMFFGGDFLINNVAGRCADKLFGTKIMEDAGKNLNFFQKFKLGLRNFRTMEQAKDIPPQVLQKTKSIGAGLYWFSLLTNTALIGFGLPKLLNKFLRYNIRKENERNIQTAEISNSGKKYSMQEFMARK